MRGRVLLGAHVTGPAAAWLLRRANLNADAIDAQRYFRSVGRADVADAIERALAELSAAEQAWRAAERNARPTSVNGSTEAALSEVRPRSTRVLLDTAAAAQRLGVTPRRVLQLLGDGSLAGEKTTGRWLVDPGSIEEHLTRRDLSA